MRVRISSDLMFGLAASIGAVVLLAIMLGSEDTARTRPFQENGTEAPAAQTPPSRERPAQVVQNSQTAKEKIYIKTGSAAEQYLDSLRYCALQMEAVLIDMELYLRWSPGDEQMTEEVGDEAISRLADLKKEMPNLATPEPCTDVARAFFRLADALQGIYTDVAAKDEEGIEEEFQRFEGPCSAYREELERFVIEPLPAEDVDIPAPQPVFQHKEHKEPYDRALRHMEDREYGKAYKILADLRRRYPGNHFILLGISDCAVRASFVDTERAQMADLAEEDPEERAIEILEDIVGGDSYSPLLCEAWLKWRTLTQSHWHGVSNYSDIPNWDYNVRRAALVRTISDHVSNNPGDLWARGQKEALLSLPNIQRGGLTGNTNLTLWGLLYASDLLEDALEKLPADEDESSVPGPDAS